MKKVSIIFLVLFAFGCTSNVDMNDIEQVEKFCGNHGGLKNIDLGYIFDDIDEIQCNDSAIYNVKFRTFYHYTSNGEHFDRARKEHYNRTSNHIILDY